MRNKITIYDIAKEADVSISTVSRILTGSAPVSKDTKRRVEAVLKKHNFRPNKTARNLSYQRSMMIGVILPDITNPFFSTVFAEIQQYAMAHDYTLLLFNAMNKLELESEGLTYLAHHQVDGLIFMGGRVNEIMPTDKYREELTEFAARVPTVIVNGNMAGASAITINTDEYSGIAQVVSYLAGLGHTRIGILGGSAHITVTRNRQEAFRVEMARLGLPIHEEWVIPDSFSIESGTITMEKLLRQPVRPTAVIAINDLVALGVLKAARQHHIDVPGKLSLVGFDDVYLSEVSAPELTTVTHNYSVLGRTIVEAIISCIDGDDVPPTIMLDMQLVIRDSCREPAR